MTNLKLSDANHARLAEELHAAMKNGNGTTPPSELLTYTMDDAYRIRRKLVDRLMSDGAKPIGHKIGFTSEAMQKMYGMTGPDFGQLMDYMVAPADQPVPIGHLSDTRVEPEICFELSSALSGPGVTIEDVMQNTAKVYASIEIIDSRVGAMRAKAVDSIADNAGAGLVVLASTAFDPNEVDITDIAVEMTVDGETLTGHSRDVMDHPAAPVAWLANRLAEIDGLGGSINAGDIIMSGSCTRSVAVSPGSKLEATFGTMGKIVLEFT